MQNDSLRRDISRSLAVAKRAACLACELSDEEAVMRVLDQADAALAWATDAERLRSLLPEVAGRVEAIAAEIRGTMLRAVGVDVDALDAAALAA